MNRPLPDEYSFAKISDPDFNRKINLVELLMFPLSNRHPNHFEQIDWTLLDIWKNICNKYMIDNEYRYIYFDHAHSYDNQEPWEDEMDEVNRAFENALTWVEKAKEEMESLCSTLYSKIADRETYPKHYPRFKELPEKMQSRSIKSDAILLPEYTVSFQDILFTKIIEFFMPVVLTIKDTVFIIERGKLTGYSEGKECTKLVCKINSTTNIVHFYPIHDNEIFKYTKVYSNPVKSNELFDLDEFDENKHFQQNELGNMITINDTEIFQINTDKK
jgi:hypothetical protein